jgi:hypothetical protein
VDWESIGDGGDREGERPDEWVPHARATSAHS